MKKIRSILDYSPHFNWSYATPEWKGGTLFDSLASFDFTAAARGCRRLIKSVLNRQSKSCQQANITIHLLPASLIILPFWRYVDKYVAFLFIKACGSLILFNQPLAYFLIKGDNVGSFPATVNLAGHRLSSTTTLESKIICYVCCCLAAPPFLSAQLKTKVKTFFVCLFIYLIFFSLNFHAADTHQSGRQGDERSRWGFVRWLTRCPPSAGGTVFWKTMNPS